MNDPSPDGSSSTSNRVVARNAMILLLAQVLGMPLSVLTNILMGRMLGPEEYGQYYLLTTFAALAFLFVDWGLGTVMPARIANDRAGAGRYLGSTAAWAVSGSLMVLLLMACIAYLRGEHRTFLVGLVLVCLGQSLALLARNASDAVRGFERTDVAAYAQFGTQLLTILLVLPALFWWGNLLACLVAIAVASLIVLIFVWSSLHRFGIPRLSCDLVTLRGLMNAGTPFLMLNLVLYLQPTIDAYFLDRYASQEAIGWLAAARKLINPLLFPAGAMTAALYPTLCRLWSQNRREFARTTQATLHIAIIVTVPLAVGCLVFAKVGVLLFSVEAYGPAQDNLRILAGYVLLLYMSMIIGTCLNAAGKQRRWTVVQSACILISLIADPLLVPWFQQHMNNGGLGVNLVTVGSELLMFLAGIALLPAGIIDRGLMLNLGRALLAGAAMTTLGCLLGNANLFISIPLSLCTYAAVLYLIGGVSREQLRTLPSIFRRRSA